MSNVVKGIIVVSIAIPVSIIGMVTAGKIIDKRSKKNTKKNHNKKK